VPAFPEEPAADAAAAWGGDETLAKEKEEDGEAMAPAESNLAKELPLVEEAPAEETTACDAATPSMPSIDLKAMLTHEITPAKAMVEHLSRGEAIVAGEPATEHTIASDKGASVKEAVAVKAPDERARVAEAAAFAVREETLAAEVAATKNSDKPSAQPVGAQEYEALEEDSALVEGSAVKEAMLPSGDNIAQETRLVKDSAANETVVDEAVAPSIDSVVGEAALREHMASMERIACAEEVVPAETVDDKSSGGESIRAEVKAPEQNVTGHTAVALVERERTMKRVTTSAEETAAGERAAVEELTEEEEEEEEAAGQETRLEKGTALEKHHVQTASAAGAGLHTAPTEEEAAKDEELAPEALCVAEEDPVEEVASAAAEEEAVALTEERAPTDEAVALAHDEPAVMTITPRKDKVAAGVLAVEASPAETMLVVLAEPTAALEEPIKQEATSAEELSRVEAVASAEELHVLAKDAPKEEVATAAERVADDVMPSTQIVSADAEAPCEEMALVTEAAALVEESPTAIAEAPAEKTVAEEATQEEASCAKQAAVEDVLQEEASLGEAASIAEAAPKEEVCTSAQDEEAEKERENMVDVEQGEDHLENRGREASKTNFEFARTDALQRLAEEPDCRHDQSWEDLRDKFVRSAQTGDLVQELAMMRAELHEESELRKFMRQQLVSGASSGALALELAHMRSESENEATLVKQMRQALVERAASGDLPNSLQSVSAELEVDQCVFVQLQRACVEAAKSGDLSQMLLDATADSCAMQATEDGECEGEDDSCEWLRKEQDDAHGQPWQELQAALLQSAQSGDLLQELGIAREELLEESEWRGLMCQRLLSGASSGALAQELGRMHSESDADDAFVETVRRVFVDSAASGDLSRSLMAVSAELDEDKRVLMQAQRTITEAAKSGDLSQMLKDIDADAVASEDHVSKLKFASLQHEAKELRDAATERAQLLAELARFQALIEAKNTQHLKRKIANSILSSPETSLPASPSGRFNVAKRHE